MNLVVTISIGGNYQKIAELTTPPMIDYAHKIGAEFKCITEQKIATTYPYWEKFIISDLLNSYNRILYLDVDTLIRKDCPNLFELVPTNEIGLYNEGLLTTAKERLGHVSVIHKAFKEYKQSSPQSWDGRFYNTGVMIIPRNMKWLFTKPSHEMFSNYWDQGYLNMTLITQNALSNVFDIGYKFNRMYYVDSKVGEHRTKSYIIHYAGIQNISDSIKHDLDCWETI